MPLGPCLVLEPGGPGGGAYVEFRIRPGPNFLEPGHASGYLKRPFGEWSCHLAKRLVAGVLGTLRQQAASFEKQRAQLLASVPAFLAQRRKDRPGWLQGGPGGVEELGVPQHVLEDLALSQLLRVLNPFEWAEP